MRRNTKELILISAASLVAERGASYLTLDEVARRAKISKGGLLYHFPTKQDLITGLIYGLIGGFNLACETNSDGRKPGTFTRAYLKSSLLDDASAASGIVSAIANNPALLAPLREAYIDWQTRLENDGIDPVVATMIRFVADGIWFSFLMGSPTIKPTLLKQLIERLNLLTQGQPFQPKQVPSGAAKRSKRSNAKPS